jgi:hypothetical protein
MGADPLILRLATAVEDMKEARWWREALL